MLTIEQEEWRFMFVAQIMKGDVYNVACVDWLIRSVQTVEASSTYSLYQEENLIFVEGIFGQYLLESSTSPCTEYRRTFVGKHPNFNSGVFVK
jgi:hypothetical protein